MIIIKRCFASSQSRKVPEQRRGKQIQDVQTRKYYYETIFATFEMHGTEGRMANYIRNINRKLTSKNIIGKGRECKKRSTISGEKDPIQRNAPPHQQNAPAQTGRSEPTQTRSSKQTNTAIPSRHHASLTIKLADSLSLLCSIISSGLHFKSTTFTFDFNLALPDSSAHD